MNYDQHTEIGYTMFERYLYELMSSEDKKSVQGKFRIASAIRDLPASIYKTIDYDLVMKEIERA